MMMRSSRWSAVALQSADSNGFLGRCPALPDVVVRLLSPSFERLMGRKPLNEVADSSWANQLELR